MNEWQTIPEMVLSAGERFGDAEAIVDGSLRITFTELTDRVRRAAGAFAAMGIDRGGGGARLPSGAPFRPGGFSPPWGC